MRVTELDAEICKVSDALQAEAHRADAAESRAEVLAGAARRYRAAIKATLTHDLDCAKCCRYPAADRRRCDDGKRMRAEANTAARELDALTTRPQPAPAEGDEIEPGQPIGDARCPCCGAELEIMHGDDPMHGDDLGDIAVIATSDPDRVTARAVLKVLDRRRDEIDLSDRLPAKGVCETCEGTGVAWEYGSDEHGGSVRGRKCPDCDAPMPHPVNRGEPIANPSPIALGPSPVTPDPDRARRERAVLELAYAWGRALVANPYSGKADLAARHKLQDAVNKLVALDRSDGHE